MLIKTNKDHFIWITGYFNQTTKGWQREILKDFETNQSEYKIQMKNVIYLLIKVWILVLEHEKNE